MLLYFGTVRDCKPVLIENRFQGGGPDVVLILCSSVVYAMRRIMVGLALLFVYVFLLSY